MLSVSNESSSTSADNEWIREYLFYHRTINPSFILTRLNKQITAQSPRDNPHHQFNWFTTRFSRIIPPARQAAPPTTRAHTHTPEVSALVSLRHQVSSLADPHVATATTSLSLPAHYLMIPLPLPPSPPLPIIFIIIVAINPHPHLLPHIQFPAPRSTSEHLGASRSISEHLGASPIA